jgi:hypothetical protein
MKPHYLGYVCGMRIACKKLQRHPSLIYPIVSDDEKSFVHLTPARFWHSGMQCGQVSTLINSFLLVINTPTK